MIGFLSAPPTTAAGQKLQDDDERDLGFVMNVSKLWGYQPETLGGLFGLLGECKQAGGLDQRQMGILVTATASALGDAYCSLAWGGKLSASADAATAASVLNGDDSELTAAEAAMASWARQVVKDPNGITAGDVQELRDAGLDDKQIFAVTTIVALRLAFSTINDALGATPDHELQDRTPQAVLDAVTYGRPMDQPA